MNDINKTIKHFESLQKRYTTQHNGQMCERVADALEALYCFKNEELEFTRKFIYGSCGDFFDCEVIGNIFENADSLEG